MGMMLFLLLVVAAAVGFWALRRAKPRTRSVKSAADDEGRGASRMEISPTEPANLIKGPRRPGRMLVDNYAPRCEAVSRIAKVWFAEGEAPTLPLSSCDDRHRCQCKWMHVVDRRITVRREQGDRRAQMRFEENSDRRSGKDRRKGSGNEYQG